MKAIPRLFLIALAAAALCVPLAAEDLKTLKAAEKLVKSKASLDLPRAIPLPRFAGYIGKRFAGNIEVVVYPDEKMEKAKGFLYDKSKAIDLTPLIEAIIFGNLEGAGHLVAHGASLNESSTVLARNAKEGFPGYPGKDSPYYRYSPLMVAAMKDDRAMAELLLRAGADPNYRFDAYHRTALELAVDVGAGPELLELLVGAGSDQTARDQALVVAAARRDLAAAGLLLKAGADPDAYSVSRWRDDRTPLQIATSLRDPAMVRLLLDAGADVNLPNRTSLELFQDLVKHKYIFMWYGSREEASNVSHPSGVGMSESILERLSRPLTPWELDQTALRMAMHELQIHGQDAEYGQWLQLTETLLDAGAELEPRNAWDSPLLLAAWCGSPELVDRVLGMGADAAYLGAGGETAIEALVRGASLWGKSKKGLDLEAALAKLYFPIADRLIASRPSREAKLAYIADQKLLLLALADKKGYALARRFAAYLEEAEAELSRRGPDGVGGA